MRALDVLCASAGRAIHVIDSFTVSANQGVAKARFLHELGSLIVSAGTTDCFDSNECSQAIGGRTLFVKGKERQVGAAD